MLSTSSTTRAAWQHPDEAVPQALDEAADVDADDEVEDDEVEDPVKAYRTRLAGQIGDWYVIHSYAGYENRVKANLENRIGSLNMEDYIFEVEVPMEEVVEIKNSQRKLVRRVRIPGYVLVRMDLTDESWARCDTRQASPASSATRTTRFRSAWTRSFDAGADPGEAADGARASPRRSRPRSSSSRSASRSP